MMGSRRAYAAIRGSRGTAVTSGGLAQGPFRGADAFAQHCLDLSCDHGYHRYFLQQRKHKPSTASWGTQQIGSGNRTFKSASTPSIAAGATVTETAPTITTTAAAGGAGVVTATPLQQISLAKLPQHLIPNQSPVFPVPPRSASRGMTHPLPPPLRKFQAEASTTESIATSLRQQSPVCAAAPAGVPNHLETKAFPLDSELHGELGAAIAAAGPPGVATHLDTDSDEAHIKGKEALKGIPDFDDPAASYTSFTNLELVRAYAVLRACAIRPLVDNSETLLKLGYAVFGETLTNYVLGKTFFAHFCAGETADQVGRRAGELQALGVGGILDYAAEVDLRPASEKADRDAKKNAAGDSRLLLEEHAQCRTYDYMGEVACDARAMTFLACIRAVRDQTPGGFAALKLTALGDPVLLSQLSTCVHLVRGLFEDFDGNNDGIVSHKEFQEGYRRWFVSESEEDSAALVRIMKRLDPEDTGGIDYVEWSNRMRLGNLAEITANCRTRGPMAAAALDEDGVALKEAIQGRITMLATAAAKAEVRLMIDAEQSWLQPAIDNTVYSLQCEFNKEFPTIFTTIQCYLKDSLERLSTDLDRAARGDYVWAGKLVRGAYMVSEREKAADEGYESPVFNTMEETHASYDAAITMVLEHMAKGNRAEVMIATHNQASIEHAISLMSKLRISRKGGVSFGQLLGMADNITLPLGSCGYKAYKYIPYGKVGETIPYLVRRAQENSGMLSGASHERGLLVKEMGRRIFRR